MTQARSSGYRHLSDTEIAQWQADRPEEFAERLSGYTSSLRVSVLARGMYLNDCPECGFRRLMHLHDYICILCRKRV